MGGKEAHQISRDVPVSRFEDGRWRENSFELELKVDWELGGQDPVTTEGNLKERKHQEKVNINKQHQCTDRQKLTKSLTDRQTVRQMDTQTDRQTDRQTNGHRQTDRQTNRQIDGQTCRLIQVCKQR